jgi:hypothetical protein
MRRLMIGLMVMLGAVAAGTYARGQHQETLVASR